MTQETPPFGIRLKESSLYVGDLRPDVTEEDLVVKFSSTVPVVSAHLCRCASTGKSLCYGYVNFDSQFSASNALACLNHTDLKGKTVRMMWIQKDPSQRRNGIGNLFVKNLDSSISSTCLERIFSPFGTILSCKVAEENGQSKGFGFVQFETEQASAEARCALHGSTLNGKKLFVAKFIKKMEREEMSGKSSDFSNLYVKNLAEDVNEDFLLKTFAPYGKVSSVVVVRDDTGRSKGFGFVSFLQTENARKAIDAMNGRTIGSKILYVGRAQTKSERTEMLKDELKEEFIEGFTRLISRLNLYVKNLSESIDEKRLREIFGRYGKIVSTKVMRHENGRSKGFGFVCFHNREEFNRAKKELNGSSVDGNPLIVRVAERREDRLRRLTAGRSVPYGFPAGFPAGFRSSHCVPVHSPYGPQLHPMYSTPYAYIQPFQLIRQQPHSFNLPAGSSTAKA